MGTADGVTAAQLDTFSPAGMPLDAVIAALDRAHEPRLAALSRLTAALDGAAAGAGGEAALGGAYGPLDIHKDKIGRLIGPGGTNLRRIEADTHCKVRAQCAIAPTFRGQTKLSAHGQLIRGACFDA